METERSIQEGDGGVRNGPGEFEGAVEGVGEVADLFEFLAGARGSSDTVTNVVERERREENINGTEGERIKSIKFLRVTISDDLNWTSHVNATVKKAQQHLFFLKRLRTFGMSI
eukprot:g46376.t1